jgi:TRAP-type mannitol/chloroaromatic compound transport system permease small subunit
MGLLKAYIAFIDSLNEKIGVFVSWLTTALVLVVCYDVFTRYFLKQSSVAVQELEWHIFAVIFLVGAGYTLKYDRHVRVDVFYMKFKPKLKALINLLGSAIFLIPFCILGIWSSKNFVMNSFMIKESSPDPGGLPARYILKAIIPLGFLFLLLQGIALAFRSLTEILDTEAANGDAEHE